MMKKVRLSIFAIALLILVFIFLFHRTASESNQPSYKKATSPALVGPYLVMHYDFLSPSPFEGGKMRIQTWSGRTNFHCYIYDLERKAVLGELTNASPVFLNHDQTQLLCSRRERPRTNSWLAAVGGFITQVSSGRIDLGHSREDAETFWVLDLERNKATELGRIYQWRGSGSDFIPSPNFRYGFNKPTGSFNRDEFYICDLDGKTFWKETISGWPSGWWDNQQLILKAANDDYFLYDVVQKSNSLFLSQKQLKTFYLNSGLTNDPANANLFFMWDGHQNQFYFSESNKRWAAKESYLIKIERPGPVLKLMDPHFKYEWSDHFDPQDKFYLYSGRERGQTNSAVYLRDLTRNETKELVASDPNDTNSFSIPRFYKDSVIYQRSNMLWEVDLDGSRNRRVFPPPDAPAQ